MNALQKAAGKILRWRADPIAFVRECFGVEPDEWQKDFLLNYVMYMRSGAKACKGPGKTTGLSWACWHFLTCYIDPKVIATSITGDNLRDGLWTEMAKWQQRSELHKVAFTWHAERIVCNENPEQWYMAARRWSRDSSKDQQANALAGLHADNIMFVIDEAGGVPDAVMAAAEAALANAETEVNPNARARLLIAGNPTHLEGPLYRACTSEAHLWKMIEITGDPDDPKRSPRISIKWAREQIQKYGRDNSWVLVNVFGKFPPASINALLGPDEVQAAMSRILRPEAWKDYPKILGVDVARQGHHRSTICPRQGPVCFKPKVLRIRDLVQVAGHVAQAIIKWQPDAVFVDATGGFGASVVDNLRNWGHDCIDVQFGGSALSVQYFNKRTEMAVEFASWIKHGGCLPDIPELKTEATAQKYTHKRDQMALIEKDQIEAEIGVSPDLFDGYGLTFAYPVAKKDPFAQFQRHEKPGEYDPIRREQEQGRQQRVDDYNPLIYS